VNKNVVRSNDEGDDRINVATRIYNVVKCALPHAGSGLRGVSRKIF